MGVGWGGGDVNVHCIASPEDVVALKIGCCIQMGEGDVNVHCIASYEDVGTLKTLLRSRCCYVEDAVTLKMLER